MISLQALLSILAFAERRQAAGKNFILLAEEPELHLHPSLHRRLANRIRSLGDQSVITTHSPIIAASYLPMEAIHVQKSAGQVVGRLLREEPIHRIPRDSVRKLYLQHREAFYEALMGAVIVVPEGQTDYQWLRLWQRVAEASDAVAQAIRFSPLSVIPTEDASVVDTLGEIRRFRPDAVPALDGDGDGTRYLQNLASSTSPPTRAIRLGTDATIECLSAWILEPCLAAPGATLSTLLGTQSRELRSIQRLLLNGTNKKDRELRENLAWEAIDCEPAMLRAAGFLQDIALIAAGQQPTNPLWVRTTENQTEVFTANHIQRV